MKTVAEVSTLEEMKNCVLWGDCLELLAKIPDNSIDLLCTDPPFAVGTTSNGAKGSWLDNNLILPFFRQFFSEIRRVLKFEGEFYVHTDWRTYPLLFPVMQEKLTMRNLIVWDYEWIKAGNYYRFSHEFIMYGGKNGTEAREFSAGDRDVWRIPPINFTSKDKLHQAQKPEALIKKMIENSTKAGGIVLDTFSGSFTTAAVAKALGRDFIACEIAEEHCRTGEQRMYSLF